VSETKVSPLATATPRDTIVTVTADAMSKLKELRSTEPDAEKLGLRLSIVSQPGEDFRYDLVFEEFLKSAFTDEVRTIEGFKFIIPANDVDSLRAMRAADQPITEPPTTSAAPVRRATRVLSLIVDP